MPRPTKSIIAAILFVASSNIIAASPEEWGRFHNAVMDECRKATEYAFSGTPTVWIEPYGTESYGVAISS